MKLSQNSGQPVTFFPALICCTLGFLFAAVIPASPQNAEVVSKAVVFLQHEFVETFSNGSETSELWLRKPNSKDFVPKLSYVSGTGFLIVDWETNFFLVTAKHVATNMSFSDNDKLITGFADGKTAVMPLAILRGANTNNWLHHDKADVSILKVVPPSQLTPFLGQHFLSIQGFLEPVTNRPSRDISLTIIGFPLGKGWGRDPDEEFAPLTRKTRASSGFIEGGTLFLLEDPAVQGYSGAPVFDLAESLTSAAYVLPSGRSTTCVGVVSGTMSDNTGGKMAGVVPTKCVMELIRQLRTR